MAGVQREPPSLTFLGHSFGRGRRAAGGAGAQPQGALGCRYRNAPAEDGTRMPCPRFQPAKRLVAGLTATASLWVVTTATTVQKKKMWPLLFLSLERLQLWPQTHRCLLHTERLGAGQGGKQEMVVLKGEKTIQPGRRQKGRARCCNFGLVRDDVITPSKCQAERRHFPELHPCDLQRRGAATRPTPCPCASQPSPCPSLPPVSPPVPAAVRGRAGGAAVTPAAHTPLATTKASTEIPFAIVQIWVRPIPLLFVSCCSPAMLPARCGHRAAA